MVVVVVVMVVVVVVGRRHCQAGSTVMFQCYCPYQGYKETAGQELRCVQRIHHVAATAPTQRCSDGWMAAVAAAI